MTATPPRFRALVTSSPSMADRGAIDSALSALRRKQPGLTIAHLGLTEGDRITDSWARMMGLEVAIHAPPEGLDHREMPAFLRGVLDLGVDGVVAFDGGDEMLVWIARQRGLRVWAVPA